MEKEKLNIAENKILKKVKEKILEVEPEAEIYLFGSRARGDFNEESDWDFLMLLPGQITDNRKISVSRAILHIEIFENQIFNRIYYSFNDWKNNRFIQATPFYRNVSKDAILL